MQAKDDIKEMAQTFREAADILDEIAELDDKSVKEAKMVTAMMIINIDRALTELETESRKEGTLYKYEAFRMHYIDGLTFEEIADQLDCGKNSPSNWCKAILKKMSVKLFGINGI